MCHFTLNFVTCTEYINPSVEILPFNSSMMEQRDINYNQHVITTFYNWCPLHRGLVKYSSRTFKYGCLFPQRAFTPECHSVCFWPN